MGGLGGRLLEMAEYVERDADMDSLERVQVGLPGLARVYDAFLH